MPRPLGRLTNTKAGIRYCGARPSRAASTGRSVKIPCDFNTLGATHETRVHRNPAITSQPLTVNLSASKVAITLSAIFPTFFFFFPTFFGPKSFVLAA